MSDSAHNEFYRAHARNRVAGAAVLFVLMFFVLPWLFPEERSLCMRIEPPQGLSGYAVMLEALSNVKKEDARIAALVADHGMKTQNLRVTAQQGERVCTWLGPYQSEQESLNMAQKYRNITNKDAQIVHWSAKP